jgi:phosphatidylethanolamine/phosphatidyl-N-methylethanolamine N-methyltransferase
VTTTLADNMRFLRALITRPRSIGALFPSSPALAKAMARQIDPDAGPVLEIGVGTGVISEAILEHGVAPASLTLLEYDEDLARHLAERFSQATVIQGDAFDLDNSLAGQRDMAFGAIVSSLPLLNHPVPRRRSYMETLTKRLTPAGVIIQFSYGPNAPVAAPPGYAVTRADLVLANIPPAQVWVYRKS